MRIQKLIDELRSYKFSAKLVVVFMAAADELERLDKLCAAQELKIRELEELIEISKHIEQ